MYVVNMRSKKNRSSLQCDIKGGATGSRVALLGGQGGHLSSQFFRYQKQKIPQNCKIYATCMYLL